MSTWLTHDLLHLSNASHLGSSVEFFAFEVPNVLLLLTVIVFAVGVVRSFFSPESTRAILAGKAESVGNVLAAGIHGYVPQNFMASIMGKSSCWSVLFLHGPRKRATVDLGWLTAERGHPVPRCPAAAFVSDWVQCSSHAGIEWSGLMVHPS